MNLDDFRKAMAQRTDADLMKIITLERDQFQPDAIRAAEEELAKRNLTVERVENARTELRAKTEAQLKNANEPLDMHWRILTFIFPMAITLILSGAYHADGFERKSKELRAWTFYGFMFYLSLLLLAIVRYSL